MLVIHYTGARTTADALNWLCNPAAKVSSHYTIDEAGAVYRHVSEERRAWHAGVSFWQGERDVNSRSIAIELANPGHEFGYVPFSGRQIAALIDLAGEIIARHVIPSRRILGHSDVAPARKRDPGELFPWQFLAQSGIGVWPLDGALSECREAIERERGRREKREVSISRDLTKYGYGLPPDVNVSLQSVITAFQRHFRPVEINGEWDIECAAIARALRS